MDPGYEDDVRAWRETRRARLVASDGWLSLVERHEIDPGETELPIGTFTRADGEVSFRARPGVEVTLDGRPVAERVLSPDEPGPPDRLLCDGRIYELVRRGDRFAIRVRDPRSPHRGGFRGIDSFPIDPGWRLVAHLAPHDPPKRVVYDYDGGPGGERVCPGTLVFTVDGREARLEPTLEGRADRGGRLFVPFADGTNRDATYAGGRFLYAPLPDAAGRVVLDFNKAFNPPCVFTPFAVCPIVPAQNRLPFRIEAGEKRYAG